MPVDRPGITASQLAQNYVASLNEFADEVIAAIAQASTATEEATRSQHRREICAALSAAMYSALDAASLSVDERKAIDPHLKSSLAPFWEKLEICDLGETEYIAIRSLHYLEGRDSRSQVKTAVTIVATLVDTLGVPADKKVEMTRTLTPIFAHRMVGDLYRLNDASTRVGIDLTMLATIAALLGISASVEPLMRLLRLT